jgi:hypothetical protein
MRTDRSVVAAVKHGQALAYSVGRGGSRVMLRSRRLQTAIYANIWASRREGVKFILGWGDSIANAIDSGAPANFWAII